MVLSAVNVENYTPGVILSIPFSYLPYFLIEPACGIMVN